MGIDLETEQRRSPAEIQRWCEDFAARCRARGVRLTAQRLAVYRALAADTSHPTAEGVYERLRAGMPTLSQATVYRILESFEREKLVRRVATTGGGARFDANRSPHQHLVCRLCGRMMDHESPALVTTSVPPGAIPGFVVEDVDIRLVGRCAKCARSSGRKAPGPLRKRDRKNPRSTRRN